MRKAEKRWNLLDWGLLAAVLAVLVGGAWLMRAKPWKRARQEVLTCTLPIGRVLAVAVVPQTVLTADGDGLALSPCPDRYVAEVTVRLTLAGRTVGSHRIAAGGTADLILGGYFAAGCGILTVEVNEFAE